MGSGLGVGEMRLRVKIYPPGKGLGDGRHLLATLSSFSLLGLHDSPESDRDEEGGSCICYP